MSEFRPRLLLCLVAIFALGALGIVAAFNVEVGRAADKAGLDSRGYVWSAPRIESGIRLRGSVPTDEDRRTVLGMVKAHFPDLQVERVFEPTMSTDEAEARMARWERAVAALPAEEH